MDKRFAQDYLKIVSKITTRIRDMDETTLNELNCRLTIVSEAVARGFPGTQFPIASDDPLVLELPWGLELPSEATRLLIEIEKWFDNIGWK